MKKPADQHDVPASSVSNEYDAEQAEEARLATEFSRLHHLYRRAGYEYYERLKSTSDWHDKDILRP